MAYLVQTHNLSKKIGDKVLIHDVNIHIKKGEIYGFLGPNGAGKTTVMKLLTNLWKPTTGSVELFEKQLTPSSYEFLKRMGSMIELPVFYEHLSGYKNLRLHCDYMGYYSPHCIEDALELLVLSDAQQQTVRSYSLGMKQRLGIARAILSKPELLILDEPINGLDPAGIKQIRDLLHMLSTEYGMTIMISSHLLSEIETLADTIGMIHQGTMLQEITMKEIAQNNLAYIALEVDDTKQTAYLLSEYLHTNHFKVIDSHSIRIYDKQITTSDISRLLGTHHIAIRLLATKSDTLEDYFLKMTTTQGGSYDTTH